MGNTMIVLLAIQLTQIRVYYSNAKNVFVNLVVHRVVIRGLPCSW